MLPESAKLGTFGAIICKYIVFFTDVFRYCLNVTDKLSHPVTLTKPSRLLSIRRREKLKPRLVPPL